MASCGVSVMRVTGPWDSVESPSEETSTRGNCVNDKNVWGECIIELYHILPFLSFYSMLCCILQRILMNETDRSEQGV